MRDELFNELIESVREGGDILRREVKPAQTFYIGASSVRSIRERHSLSQGKFAAMLGISVATLRNWEQGRRAPEGPARILLQVADKHPEAIWDVVGVPESRNKKPDNGKK